VKERPILFNGEMVRAILEGRKTQTRRLVNPQPREVSFPGISSKHGPIWPMFFGTDKKFKSIPCPFGQVGDTLWVRETWFPRPILEKSALYKADSEIPELITWRPSIHMPRWASRITLRITNVKVKRLKEITVEEINEEGTPATKPIHYADPYLAFSDLWNSINAQHGFGWDTNPWVWVIEFKRSE
jgi:hypothetical protein